MFSFLALSLMDEVACQIKSIKYEVEMDGLFFFEERIKIIAQRNKPSRFTFNFFYLLFFFFATAQNVTNIPF